MSEKILIDPASKDFGTVLRYAVGYALGGQTYAPEIVADFVTGLIPDLDQWTLIAIARNIDMEQDFGRKPDRLGDPCGQQMWLKLLENIKSQLERRRQRR